MATYSHTSDGYIVSGRIDELILSMGNKHSHHSRSTRSSIPDRQPHRRSLWRGRRSVPSRLTFNSPRPAPTRRAPNRVANRPTPIQIQLTNLCQNEKLIFPLVMIEGAVQNLKAASVPDSALYVQAIANAVQDDGSTDNSWVGSVCWPVVRDSGHFKAYVHLPHPGAFRVRLRIATTTHQLTVQFAPQKTKWIVRFHFQQPRDSFHGFDAPSGVDNSDSDACQRLKFNAMVLQTAIAELFHRAGFARKTFSMELDADGLPTVNVLRSEHTIDQARRMTDTQLLSNLRHDIQQGQPDKAQYQVKHVILLGGSHYDPHARKVPDYKALVGGDVIATSACSLFTWPSELYELTASCFNSDSVPRALSVAQCSVRRSYWAHYSGGLSVLLHLLGLSFGLGYRSDGVMRKSFRGVSRLLTVMEPCIGEHQSVFVGRSIGDGRFCKLYRQGLKPVGAAPDDIYLDKLDIGELAINCRWINPCSMKSVFTAKPTLATAA